MEQSIKIGKEDAGYFISSILNSYSQIFFSTYRPYAILVILVSFINFPAGLAGLVAVFTTSILSFVLNFDKPTIAKGLYGFNSLLVGLGLGSYFSFDARLVLIVVLASMLSLFISIALQGVIGKYHLPYLSIPFILSLWMFLIATRSFEALGISERGIYNLNELYQLGGTRLVNLHEWFIGIPFPKILSTYFISMSAILFQFSIFSGIILTFGLLLYSRIAFTLSVLGFTVAFLFYQVTGAEISQIDYSYIGFNYILTSIALGGFFLIPSFRSYLWVAILIPLVAVLTISLNSLFMEFKLPIYSLPFNIIVLLFIYVLKFRMDYSYKLSEVYFQHNWPEKNLYIFLNNKDRFRYKRFKQLKLPFFGTWDVSQGHNGEHTHKQRWKHAWDFVILDKNEKQFKREGDFREDYYCFGKPVIAPGDGTIETIIDNIEENTIGEVNLENNWGNTIIIRHDDNLYSKLSHLQKDSIKVNDGDKVKYGQVIAACGNTGRSPYPHLHFQVQEYPFIGSSTYDYPISNFVLHKNRSFSLKSHDRPLKGEKISNIEVNELLRKGFSFTPGEVLKFNVSGYKKLDKVSWEVKVNHLNESYFECSVSGSIAYFEQDDNLFYFTYFDGSKNCLLYYFFLSCLKVQEGFYNDLILKDKYPLYLVYPKAILWFHDLISPFVQLIESEYSLHYQEIDDLLSPGRIKLKSSMKNKLGKLIIGESSFDITIERQGLEMIKTTHKGEEVILERCRE